MLTLIFGRQGSGKSAYLYQLAAQAARKGVTGQIFLVPETHSHEAERRLCQAGGDSISLSCEVLTFRRLANRVFAAAGGLAWAFPESVVRFFARKFDAGRLNMASQMLRILVPWAAASIFLSLLGVWNVFRGRYSLNITLSCLGYASMIPMILAASRLWGVYSVAIVYSVMLVCLTGMVWRVTGDFPLRSGGTALPPGTMRLVGRDTALCLGIVGASSLYQLVDR